MGSERKVQRMLALEASGAPLSRNAAYELCEDPSYREAIQLRQRLGRLALDLRRGRVPAAVRARGRDRIELRFVDARARYRRSLFLCSAEIDYLLALDPGLSALLAQRSISTDSERWTRS